MVNAAAAHRRTYKTGPNIHTYTVLMWEKSHEKTLMGEDQILQANGLAVVRVRADTDSALCTSG